MGLIGQRFPRSFVNSAGCDSSIDSIESIDSVIFTPSITNYHSQRPPIFNPNRGLKGGFDLKNVQL